MINCYYKYDFDRRLVPDPKYEDINENIGITYDDHFVANDIEFYADKNITFLNASIIRMLLLSEELYGSSFYNSTFIKIKFNMILYRDVIYYKRVNFHWSLINREYDYYYIIPYDDKIRIVTTDTKYNTFKDHVLTVHNAVFQDIPLNTSIENLYDILYDAEKKDFVSFPKFMRNTPAYNDIQFEFVD